MQSTKSSISLDVAIKKFNQTHTMHSRPKSLDAHLSSSSSSDHHHHHQKKNAAPSSNKNKIMYVLLALLCLFTLDRVYIHPSFTPNKHYSLHNHRQLHERATIHLQLQHSSMNNNNDEETSASPHHHQHHSNHQQIDNNNVLVLSASQQDEIYQSCAAERNIEKPHRMKKVPSFTRKDENVRPRFAVVTMFLSNNLGNYSDFDGTYEEFFQTSLLNEKLKKFAFFNLMQYCKRNGYDLIIESDSDHDDESEKLFHQQQASSGDFSNNDNSNKNNHHLHTPTSEYFNWAKFKIIRKHLRKYEYILYVSPQTLFMNWNLKIEDFIDDVVPIATKVENEKRRRVFDKQHQQQSRSDKTSLPNNYLSEESNPDLIFANSFTGLNADVFFIKNSKWSREFLKRVYRVPDFLASPLSSDGAFRFLLDDGRPIPKLPDYMKSVGDSDHPVGPDKRFDQKKLSTKLQNAKNHSDDEEQRKAEDFLNLPFGASPYVHAYGFLEDAYLLKHRQTRLVKTQEEIQFARAAQKHVLILDNDKRKSKVYEELLKQSVRSGGSSSSSDINHYNFTAITGYFFLRSFPRSFVLHPHQFSPLFEYRKGDWLVSFPSCLTSYSKNCLSTFEQFYGTSLCENSAADREPLMNEKQETKLVSSSYLPPESRAESENDADIDYQKEFESPMYHHIFDLIIDGDNIVGGDGGWLMSFEVVVFWVVVIVLLGGIVNSLLKMVFNE